MNRREWALGATSVALSGLSLPLWAQGGPVEGKDFHRVFDDLCEVIKFDAESYAAEGFDRKDV